MKTISPDWEQLDLGLDDALGKILQIGLERAPNEACGLLWWNPEASRLKVLELPNRSKAPAGSYEMNLDDIQDESLYDQDLPAFWHTHPSGLIGPSLGDLRHRPTSNVGMLVVTWQDGVAFPVWF